MSRTDFYKLFACLLIISMVLTACGAKPVETVEAPAAETSRVTTTGFVCPEPTPRVEVASQELNILARTESIPQEMLDCFEMVYGIELVRMEYSNPDEMYEKVTGGENTPDLILSPDYMVPRLIHEGRLQGLDSSKLSAIANLDEAWMDQEFDPGNQYSLPYLAGTDAIVVNTTKITKPPQSWSDLWDTEYGGRMVVLDDARVMIGVALLTLGYDPNTTDPAQLEEARLKLTQFIPFVKLFDSDSPKTALGTGDVEIGITRSGEAFKASQANPSIEYVYPQEGAIFWQENWVIPADSAHADAAYAWLSYLLQGDVFWLTLRDFAYTIPNLAALEYAKINSPEIYSAYMESPIIHPPSAAVANGHTLKDVGDAAPLYEAIWAEVRGQ
ncbi:MAG: spermidine/putrescine ABC transporter substrate-binding protein [Chloroflexi bacterium]|nr:spermidine/putrescine ABC transporter substrate-binding protein [Chloroflexota bacterium]